MASPSENRERIRTYGHAALLKLLAAIFEDSAEGWEPGAALEYLILRAFELEGAKVRYPFLVSDPTTAGPLEQMDGVVYWQHHAFLVETKDTAERVNFRPLAYMRSQLMRRPAQLVGMFFSRSGYTEAAKELARSLPPQTILLWDGGEIEYAVANGKLAVGAEVKLRYAMEEAESAFDIRAEFEP